MRALGREGTEDGGIRLPRCLRPFPLTDVVSPFKSPGWRDQAPPRGVSWGGDSQS